MTVIYNGSDKIAEKIRESYKFVQTKGSREMDKYWELTIELPNQETDINSHRTTSNDYGFVRGAKYFGRENK
jgi:hypothetical protein